MRNTVLPRAISDRSVSSFQTNHERSGKTRTQLFPGQILRCVMGPPLLTRRSAIIVLGVAIVSLVTDLLTGAFSVVQSGSDGRSVIRTMSLPPPSEDGSMSVETAISGRRSRREYGDVALERQQLGQLLWAAQGITDPDVGLRAAPSAGALYPLELYAVVGDNVRDVEPGIYRYQPETHTLALLQRGDQRSALQSAAIDQDVVGRAHLDFVFCAVDQRSARKYGSRGVERFVPLEAGHAAENVYLQAQALNLSTVTIGSFDDSAVRRVVGAPSDQRPLYVMPTGTRSEEER